MEAADAAVAALASLVESSVKEARRGAALAMSGTDPPAPLLQAAADRLEKGLATVDAAQEAMATLAGVAAATDPTLHVPDLAANGFALTSIVSQLRAAADAATVFVERRKAADAVLGALQDAIAALGRHDPHTTLDRVDDARASLAILTAWQQAPAALIVWLSTTGDLVDATAAIAAATISGDRRALATAASEYDDASAAARQADSALAIAMAEGGSATTSVPLRGMAGLLASAGEVRASLAGLLAHP